MQDLRAGEVSVCGLAPENRKNIRAYRRQRRELLVALCILLVVASLAEVPAKAANQPICPCVS